MESKAHHVLVGAAALLFAAGILVVLVWVVGLQAGRDRNLYRVDFAESVSGLEEGSPVRLNGVEVGQVERIDLSERRIGRVEVVLALREALTLHEGASAQLKPRGITGAKFLAVQAGDPDAPPLTAPEGRLPALEPEASTLSAMMDQAPQIVADLRGVAARLNRVLGREDAQLARIVANLAKTSAAAPEAVAAVEGAAREASELIGEGRPAVRSAERTLDSARETLESAQATLRSADGVMRRELPRLILEARRMAGSLSSAAQQLERVAAENREPVRRFTTGGLADVRRLVNEARVMVDQITRLADRLESDPNAVLFGRPEGSFEPEDAR